MQYKQPVIDTSQKRYIVYMDWYYLPSNTLRTYGCLLY